MREVFVDTFYWAAILDRRDPFHLRALEVSRTLRGVRFVTTDEVLIEVLSYFSSVGTHLRAAATETIKHLLASNDTEVIAQSRDLFLAGFKLYEARPDKEYSGVDAISMAVMKERGITEILTHDHHFAQEGFVLLL